MLAHLGSTHATQIRDTEIVTVGEINTNEKQSNDLPESPASRPSHAMTTPTSEVPSLSESCPS